MISEAENIEHASNFRGSRMEFDFRGRHKSHDGSTFSTDVSDEEDFSSGDEDDVENGKKRKHENCPKTKDQLDRRRERNRVLARKTRLRKKSFFETLQKQVALLAIENDMLKGIVRQRLGGSKSASSVKNAPLGSAEIALSNSRANTILEHADDHVKAAIQAAQRSFTITDPSQPDNPIIFASKGFLELSGYSLENTLGRNCRFLQGPGTDMAIVEQLQEGIRTGKDTSVCLLNYRADGTPFFNQIFVAAIRDPTGTIINYVGVQVEIKSLLDPNSSIDLEDFCINKIPKKGRPRTRELKEPKVPKNKELKDLKMKVPTDSKSAPKSIVKKTLATLMPERKLSSTSTSSSSSSSVSSNSSAKTSFTTSTSSSTSASVSSSVCRNEIQMYEVKEEIQFINMTGSCATVPIISAGNSPKLVMKKRPLHKISGKPDYYNQSDLQGINEVSEKSELGIDIVPSGDISQTFSTYIMGGGFHSGIRSESTGTLNSEESSDDSMKSSEDGSNDSNNFNLLRRKRTNMNSSHNNMNGHGNNGNVSGTIVGDSYHGGMDMNMSVTSMTSLNGAGGVLSNQTIDELFFMFGRDQDECDNGVDSYMFQFGEEEASKIKSEEYQGLLVDSDLSPSLGEDDVTWNFY